MSQTRESGRSGERPHALPAFHRSLIVTALLAFSGCASTITETRHLTIEHAFTDAAAARALKEAQTTCAQKRLVAVKTSSACTLTRCTTHYQCMDKADANKYRQ